MRTHIKGGFIMSKETTIIIAKTISGIVSTLVIGEVFGSVISNPIRAMKTKNSNVDLDNLAELIDVMNQRICDLEDKVGTD